MNETFKFLKGNTQVNYLATVKGDKPSCRPFGDPIMYDGKIYVITSKHKELSKQIAENNNVCILTKNLPLAVEVLTSSLSQTK